ncbi:hypothetical protein QTP70_001239 [Hemibagrus guttatus]|uniref:CCHC-type domain-containing protein n=1 Tax=Hemibagrus guttatus TaxID=175788 RepID=A0AAE0R690_9TELE|nr:hypothetical protein QTP70_001239 [Hemibagrus guttatus]
MASLFARFWIGFALRAVIPWKGTSPWSTDRPWHYQKVAEFIRGHPWCLVDGLVLDHRKLYKRWRDCWAAQSGQTHPQMPGVEWAAMQPTWLDGASKDLHWLGALRRLPVRERLYRHGISPTPLCPIGCGGEETVEHALWSCPVAARFWRRVSEWWSAEEGAGIDRDLVLYGRGLKRMGPETANPLWQTVSVAKCVLWGARCECIRSQTPRVRQVDLFPRVSGQAREVGPATVRQAKGITGYRFSAYRLRSRVAMEREGDRRPARVVRLRHSVRIQLRPDVAEDVKKRFGWDWVVLRILRDFAGISPGKLLCLQDFTAVGFLDVTFSAFSDCSAFFGKCSRRPEEEVLRGLCFVPLFAMDEVPVTVHIYNPYIADEDIRAFLGRYCASVSAGGKKNKGRFGIWNGKRRFLVKLKMDPASPGGLLHPPGSFALGPNRGFLHYPGQPLRCWKCGAAGHTKEACTGRRCRLCGSEEHLAAECSTPKTCSLCGSEKHLFRQCPSRKGTFASLFSGEDIAAGVPEAAVRSEVKQGPSGQKPVELAEQPGDSRQEAHATMEEGAVEQAGAPPGGKAVRGGSGRHCDICGPLASFGGDHHRGGLDPRELGGDIGRAAGDAEGGPAGLGPHGLLGRPGGGGRV